MLIYMQRWQRLTRRVDQGLLDAAMEVFRRLLSRLSTDVVI
jgi:hypothetical protein